MVKFEEYIENMKGFQEAIWEEKKRMREEEEKVRVKELEEEERVKNMKSNDKEKSKTKEEEEVIVDEQYLNFGSSNMMMIAKGVKKSVVSREWIRKYLEVMKVDNDENKGKEE